MENLSGAEFAGCQGVSFQICRGDRVCLKGRNGSGKSSIIRKILGEEIPGTGELYLGAGLKISRVPQDTEQLWGRLEDYAKGLDIEETLFKAVLRKLDFDRSQFDRDIRDYSKGQKKKVLLAGSLCERTHLYIWDEPLNYIDILSRIQIENLILEFEPAMLFVEHDRTFQEKVATKVVEL